MDARNHGDSPHAAQMDYDLMANDIRHMIAQLNNGSPVTLIGHSLGGRTAMTMALSPASTLIDKLVIADIAPTSSSAQIANWKVPTYIKILQGVDLDKFATRTEVDQYISDKITVICFCFMVVFL